VGNQHVTWTRDIDRLAPSWLIQGLAEFVAQQPEQVACASVDARVRLLSTTHECMGWGKWVLPLGIWHRRRRLTGVQYCPLCLRFDAKPYVRVSWRLAFYTECEWHHCMMRDRCHACEAPFEYFRGELGQRFKIEAPSMNVCTSCGEDLGYGPVAKACWPNWPLTYNVRNLLMMNSTDVAVIGNRLFNQPSDLWLALRQVIALMSSRGRAGEIYDAAAKQLWPYGYSVLSRRGQIYERRGIEERHRLFVMAVWALMEPGRLDDLLAEVGLSSLRRTRGMSVVPDWFVAAGSGSSL